MASAIYLEERFLSRGESISFATWAIPPADPVLHLLREGLDGTWNEVAWSDNAGGGVDASVAYTNPGRRARFLLVMRAAGDNVHGWAMLARNGGLTDFTRLPVGGELVRTTRLTFGRGDTLHAVPMPGGSVYPMVAAFYMVAAGGTWNGIGRLGLDGGVGGATSFEVRGSEVGFLVGTPWMRSAEGALENGFRAGWARLLANDVGAGDRDGDGLGDELEDDLWTCSDLDAECEFENGGFTYSAQDTDRDGLTDADEVLGVAGDGEEGVDDLAFPRMGADPRHKDVFLEVDWITGLDPNAPGRNPFRTPALTPEPTAEEWVDALRAPFEVGAWDSLHNPDQTDGVSLHLDLGVEPLDPNDERLFGDWESSSVHGIVPDCEFSVSGEEGIDGVVTLTINGNTIGFDATGYDNRQIAQTLWVFALAFPHRTWATENRVRYEDGTATFSLRTTTPGLHFTCDVTVPAGTPAGKIVVAREDASSVRDEAWRDPESFAQVRSSRFRYALVSSLGGGGNADGARVWAGIRHATLGHELGHTLGLQHFGHTTWITGDPEDTQPRDTEYNCFPYYRSAMNYAYDQDDALYFFSGAPFQVFDPSAVTETWLPGLAPPFDAGAIEDIFNLDQGLGLAGPDWNLSRINEGTPVGAPMRAGPNDNCRTFGEGWQRISAAPPSTGRMEITRVGNWLVAAWLGPDRRMLARTGRVDTNSFSGCTGFVDPLARNPGGGPDYADGCVHWGIIQAPGALVPDATDLSAEGQGTTLLVAIRREAGTVIARAFDVSTTTGILSMRSQRVMPINGNSAGDIGTLVAPAAAGLGWTRRTVWVVDRQPFNAGNPGFRMYWWDSADWRPMEHPMLSLTDEQGLRIPSGGGPPALVMWPDPRNQQIAPELRTTCAILPNADGGAAFYCFDPVGIGTPRWRDRNDSFHSRRATTEGGCVANVQVWDPNAGAAGRCLLRPGSPVSLAFRYLRGSDGAPLDTTNATGHLMMVYTLPNNDSAQVDLTALISAANPILTHPNLRSGWFREGFFNTWHDLTAPFYVPLYSDSRLDTVYALSSTTERIFFHPFADGVLRTTYATGNDFGVMEDYICARLLSGDLCGGIDVFR